MKGKAKDTAEEVFDKKIKDILSSFIRWNFPSMAKKGDKKLSWNGAVVEIKKLFTARER